MVSSSSSSSPSHKGRGNKGGGGHGHGHGNGFQALGLSDAVFRGIVRMGFRTPTPVQRKSLPIILSGSDTVVMARTGSGKTIAFLIPIVERLIQKQLKDNQTTNRGSASGSGCGCGALILSPTRELSLQTLRVADKLTHFTSLKSVGINGGESMEKQFNALASQPDIIIATPGRLAHHLSEIPDFELRSCQMLTLDEADRLLEMGFAMQIRQIASTLPDYCQKLMLSATMPRMLMEFTKSGFSTDPQVVRLDQEATVSDDLRIAFITCRTTEKDSALLHILSHIQRDKDNQQNQPDDKANANTCDIKDQQQQSSSSPAASQLKTGLTLVFAATRHHVEYISTLLSASGINNTSIYGSLDQEARKANLAAFRQGRKSVLVVTDVAARGIDCPLVDHVIHYAFPANPKLFVHRSGRAARAGRIGYCWGLVDPEEMPYMVDLHLFLGRKLKTAADHEQQDMEDSYSYTLDTMTPELVHYGSIPEQVLNDEIDNVRRIMESELTGSNNAESLRALTKVCVNAMKQYRKTRPEPSKEGIRRAKAIMEGERLETGQRLGGGAIVPHPLLQGMVQQDYKEQLGKKKGNINSIVNVQNARKRQDFLVRMSQFRPKETVFEAFQTRGAKEAGTVSQVDRGRTSLASNKKQDTSVAFNAMKDMRRQMRIAHEKGSSLVVAGSTNAQVANGDFEAMTMEESSVKPEQQQEQRAKLTSLPSRPPRQPTEKKRMSRAERKRQKKGKASDDIGEGADHVYIESEKKTKQKKGQDFRDDDYFIDDNLTTNLAEAARSRQIEAAMQPSASERNLKSSFGAALRLEEAIIDIAGDDHADLAQKQRMMRWDKSKRKYVQTTVGKELQKDSKSKKMRLESGQIVKGDKMVLGQLYQKWQKKTNRSIGRQGVFDDIAEQNTESSDFAAPRKQAGNKGKGAKSQKGKPTNDQHAKSVVEIRKDRERKQDLKLKNMRKSDRRRIESKRRQGKKSGSSR